MGGVGAIAPRPTAVFDTYWHFAAERQAMLARRLAGAPAPWTVDPVLARHRFPNCYRVADRVSQYLLTQVQYRPDRPQSPRELFFRTALFKLFNRVATWEALERVLGPLTSEVGGPRVRAVLDAMRARGERLYSAAYVIPPAGATASKHEGHLALLAAMIADRVPERAAQLPALADVYHLLRGYRGLGPFLAFQLAVDLNYSPLLDHDEGSFVVAGPGALDGLAKCFGDWRDHAPEALIAWTAARQDREFSARGLSFPRPGGRPLQLVDCQNLFCEISKYARAAYPDIVGVTGRTRIKQGFTAVGTAPLRPLHLPRKWIGSSAAAAGDIPVSPAG